MGNKSMSMRRGGGYTSCIAESNGRLRTRPINFVATIESIPNSSTISFFNILCLQKQTHISIAEMFTTTINKI